MADTTISATDLETLEYLQSVLYSFMVRNNNQHRRSIWWRPFSILRKQLDLLLKDAVKIVQVPDTNLARTKKKPKDRKRQACIDQRLQFWQDVMVPRWQHAFSQVIADGRFAVLGLVLYASLAQICKITGLTAKFEDLGQAEMQRVLEAFGNEEWQGEHSALEQRASGEDVGEVVQRDEVVDGAMESAPPAEHQLSAATASSEEFQPFEPEVQRPPKRKLKTVEKPAASEASTTKAIKKRKKKGNAIDDLFSGL